MENTDIPFGHAKNGKLFLNGWGGFSDREIGEVRNDDLETSVAFFLQRYSDLQTKIDEVTKKIDETENKGSFLMKLLHLKEQLPHHDGLGDYPTLLEKLDRYESLVKDIIQKNRARNTEIKTALIAETKEAIQSINWKEGTEQLNDIKARWIKTGNAEQGKNEELDEEFWTLTKSFFDRKKNFFEDKQRLTQMRQKQYESLVSESETINQLFGKARFDRIKALREEWKNVGGVPSEIFKPLIEQFNNNLKPKHASSPKTDYSTILTSLRALKTSKDPINKKELELIRKNAFSDKSRNPAKREVLEWVQLLMEKDFINNLAARRFKDFHKLDGEKKKSIRIGIVKDLITRDKEDLKTYEENSANFSSHDGKFNKMVVNKLKNQQRKINIKEKLLEWIMDDAF
ncbi:MAG: DUF349 domain-containing protein [Bacteroidota bacterium]